jgi:hypothetical protein
MILLLARHVRFISLIQRTATAWNWMKCPEGWVKRLYFFFMEGISSSFVIAACLKNPDRTFYPMDGRVPGGWIR